MIPDFDAEGKLPNGIHWAEWTEVVDKFGLTAHRKRLLMGLKMALEQLKAAGCSTFYLDGSFVTAKEHPEDYDACWDVVGVDPTNLDPIFFDFLDFDRARAAQKAKYFGEFSQLRSRRASPENDLWTFFRRTRIQGRQRASSL